MLVIDDEVNWVPSESWISSIWAPSNVTLPLELVPVTLLKVTVPKSARPYVLESTIKSSTIQSMAVLQSAVESVTVLLYVLPVDLFSM